MRRRATPPLWFLLALALLEACAWRALAAHVPALAPGAGLGAPPAVAIFQLLVLIAGAIWKGLEVAARVTLEALAWSVKALWAFATSVWKGLKTLGSEVLAGLKRAWGFFRETYDKVLKPAWQKFWRWFDRFRKWLDDTFGPLLRHLRDLRDALLKFWKTYIRPWLDLIDVTRHLLNVLGSLGLSWARTLDAKLGALEEKIQRPFLLLLGKLNEVINVVNQVVGRDGLLQRVALIRSIARDYQYAWQAIANPYRRDPTADERAQAEKEQKGKTLDQITSETQAYMRDQTGPLATLFEEQLVIWRHYLVSR